MNDNSTTETGFVIGPISTPDAWPSFLGFVTLPPNSTYGRFTYRYHSGGIFPAFVFATIDDRGQRIFSELGDGSGQFVTIEGGSHCAGNVAIGD